MKQLEEGADSPGVAPSYYHLRALEKVVPTGVAWFEAMQAELFQLDAVEQETPQSA